MDEMLHMIVIDDIALDGLDMWINKFFSLRAARLEAVVALVARLFPNVFFQFIPTIDHILITYFILCTDRVRLVPKKA